MFYIRKKSSAILVIAAAGGVMSDIFAQITAAGIASNGQLDTNSLPANAVILMALFRETAGHAVSVSLGSSLGASDVTTAQPVPASGTLMIQPGAFLKDWFSASSTQAIYVTSASWGSASINASLVYMVGP